MPKVWNKRDPSCPRDAVYVGRPSKWGNPYHIGEWEGSSATGYVIKRKDAVRLYKDYLQSDKNLTSEVVQELRGKDLVCWCAPLQCHADILLEVANA